MSTRNDDTALRPTRLDEFGGQPDITRQLGVLLEAARQRGELTDHVLLHGPPGLGKTTLAAIIANELGVPLRTTTGPALERPGDLAGLLTSITAPTVLFIDEIHRLPRVVEEQLYTAMEDRRLDIIVGEGTRARTVPLTLEPFTLVGATTEAGMLAAPLRDRFGFSGRLEYYPDDEIGRIVRRSADLLGVELDDGTDQTIADRSRGTPRVANMWLRRVRDYAQVNGHRPVTPEHAEAALDTFGIDRLGLDKAGRRVLETLITTFNGGPVGLGPLSKQTGEAVQTIEEVYEPVLMRFGMVARTPRGRVATAAAYQHLGLPVPDVAPADASSAGRIRQVRIPRGATNGGATLGI